MSLKTAPKCGQWSLGLGHLSGKLQFKAYPIDVLPIISVHSTIYQMLSEIGFPEIGFLGYKI